MIMNIPYHKLNSRGLFTTAHYLGALSAVLTYAGTHNVWLALAVSFISLMMHTLHVATVWQIAELQQDAEEAFRLDHHKVVMPEPRHEHGDRFTPSPRFTTSGYTLPQVLWACACFTGVLLFIPACYAIAVIVMGAQEPRW